MAVTGPKPNQLAINALGTDHNPGVSPEGIIGNRPRPPERFRLTGDALKEWVQVVNDWPEGHFRDGELGGLARYCVMQQQWMKITEEISAPGFQYVITTPEGIEKPNPLLDAQAKTSVQLDKLMSRFRLCVSMRIQATQVPAATGTGTGQRGRSRKQAGFTPKLVGGE